MEACRKFEASDRNRHGLFRREMASRELAPDCLVFVEGTCRFGVKFLTGPHSIKDGRWYHRETDDGALDTLYVVEFDVLFDRGVEPIGEGEFANWHTEAISVLQAFEPQLSVGWLRR